MMDEIEYTPAGSGQGWTTLPGLTRQARRLAAEACPHALGALRRTGCDMIVVHFHGLSGRRRRRTVTAWTRTGAAYRVHTAPEQIGSGAIDAIAGSLWSAVREISGRWPSNARPDAIGLALDGDVIAFNVSHPACDGTAWLDGHLTGRAPCALIHDGGGTGALTRLSPRRN